VTPDEQIQELQEQAKQLHAQASAQARQLHEQAYALERQVRAVKLAQAEQCGFCEGPVDGRSVWAIGDHAMCHSCRVARAKDVLDLAERWSVNPPPVVQNDPDWQAAR